MLPHRFTQPIHAVGSSTHKARTSAPWVKVNQPIRSLKSDRVNLVAPASPMECLPYQPKVRAIQYNPGPERLTRLVNSFGSSRDETRAKSKLTNQFT